MWRRRTNIPHDIDATATLIEAQLHDDPDVNSVEAIRSTSAEAFARYDNHFHASRYTNNF